MIDVDLTGLPLPADAPEAGACVELERPEAGLVILRLVPPHRSLAVLDLPLMRDLAVALDELSREDGLKGLVIAGREPGSFAAGADIDGIERVTDEETVGRTVRLGQAVFEGLHQLSARRRGRVRTIAAVGGPVPGGAFELSLACSYIVAADLPSSKIGLPETQLGIIPAWGGCTRLPRRVGVPGALAGILAGKLLPAKAAYKKGWIDRVTPPERLIEIASDLALGRLKTKRRSRGFLGKWFVDRNPLAAWILERGAIKQVEARAKGHYPAPVEAAKVVSWSCLRSRAKSLEAEAVTASKLAVGSVCKSLVGVFQLMEGAKKLGKDAKGEAPALERGAVLGAGVMGGAIASVMAEKGVDTRLFDISPEGLDAAVILHRKEVGKKKRRRRMERHVHDAAVDRLTTSTELIGFERAEFVIEAVAEILEVKLDVLGKLADCCGEDAILATNTSSLSVDDIAAALPNPERVVGMHFFNPVRKMPLVEIVRGSQTSDEVVTKTAALALRMGKTPVVVKDVAGFLVNRLLGPYLDEAIRLYTSGVDPERLDRLAEEFGMPMGPMRLLDEVGLDIAGHAALSLHSAYGDRMAPCTAIRPLLEAGHLGKKTGRGFYDHRKVKSSTDPLPLNAKLAELAPATSHEGAELPDSVIIDHLTFAMLAEGLRALEENVTQTPDELDLATVFGMGFAPFRGGLLRWADSLGADEVQRRLETLRASRLVHSRGGGAARFDTPDLLEKYAAEGRKFRP